jgi:uncharacterized protein Smg (DUF494 family)
MKSPITNIVKIMTLVVRELETKGAFDPTAAPMISKLLRKGFSMDDIDAGLKWLSMITSHTAPLLEAPPSAEAAARPPAIRQLHAAEAIRLTPEAQRMLLQWIEEGRTTPLQFERTIEYIWKNDLRQVSASRLEVLLSMNEPQGGVPPEVVDGQMPSLSVH